MGSVRLQSQKDVPENLPLSLYSCPSCSSSPCFLRVYHGRFPPMRPRDTESFGGVRPRDNSGRVAWRMILSHNHNHHLNRFDHHHSHYYQRIIINVITRSSEMNVALDI